MEENLIKLGVMLILLGFFLVFAGAVIGVREGNVKFGFGGFIGPIPFGFANDPRMLWIIIAISILMLVLFFLFIKQI